MRCFNLCSVAATKSTTEVTLGDLKLEKEHFKYHRDVELAQVGDPLRMCIAALAIDVAPRSETVP